MKEGWEYSTIGELCNKINGLWKGKKEPFVNVGVIRNANFTKDFTLSFDNIEYLDVEAKQYKTRKLEKGDLIVEKSGGSEKQPVGRTILFEKEEGEYSFSNFTSVLRIKDWNVISPKFLYKYILFVYLRGDTRKMQKATTGIHNIEFDKFLSIPVPVPPLSEQQSIVDYLDSAFAKIDAMKANAEKALNEAKALFQASLKEMLEPKEGWEEKKLQDVARDFSRGKSKHRPRNDKKLFGGKYPFIQTGEIRNSNVYVTSHSSTYNELGLSQSKLWPEDTVCITIAANIAEVAILKYPSCFPDSVIGFVADNNKVDKLFVYYSILNYQQELKKQGKGSAQDNINLGTFEKNKFPFPSLQEQQSIVATLDSLKSKIDRLQENCDKISKECDALKQAILRKVFE